MSVFTQKWFRYTAAASAGILVIWVAAINMQPDSKDRCIKVEISSSTEKKDLLDALAESYDDAGRNAGGRCSKISVSGLTSGKAEKALAEDVWKPELAEGEPQPQVWAPSTSIWLDLLRLDSGGRHTGDRWTSIATSPLVVALRKEKGEYLKTKNLTLDSILGLAGENGWASIGRPQWGRFQFAKDDPETSSSGLVATVGTYNAAAKNAGDENADVVPNLDAPGAQSATVRIIRKIEANVTVSHDDLTVLMGRLVSEDAGRQTTAIATQESLAYQFNSGTLRDSAGRETGPPSDKLVAVYPKGGTYVFDHPYIILPGIQGDQRAVAEDFLKYLQENAQQTRFAKDGFRSADKARTASAELLGSLGANDAAQLTYLPVPPAEKIRQIIDQAAELRKKSDILFVIDTSGSMREPFDRRKRLKAATDAIIANLDKLNTGDKVGLWSFSSSDSTHPGDPWVEHIPLGQFDRAKFIAALRTLTPARDTALYTTLLAAQRHMIQKRQPKRISALVVLTDGVNDDPTGQPLSLDGLLAGLQTADPRTEPKILGIAFALGRSSTGYKILNQITRTTNLDAVSAKDPAKINDDFAALFNHF